MSSSSNLKYTRGVTLLELLVTLVILSILASIALPYAEITVKRNKEVKLSQNLREIRKAIDQFHEDWASGRITHTNSAGSEDGYPKTLQVLVDGVDTGKAKGRKIRYLRQVPIDPFDDEIPVDNAPHWQLRGYQDEPDSILWNGKDVYDVHSTSDGQALDGTSYKNW